MSVPVELDRDAAARLARAELAKPAYHRDDPGLAQRFFRWLLDRLGDLLASADDATGGRGWLALLLVVLLAVVVVVVLRWRIGPVSRRAADQELFSGRPQSADEHRRAADAHAAAQRFDLAARERLRAIVRSLEERGLLDPRPGRTVTEAAREAGSVLPTAGEGLARAARTFEDVWYGGRPADATTDALLREVDEAVRRARPPVGPVSRNDRLVAPQ